MINPDKSIKLLRCARCDGDHDVQFIHFKGNPVIDPDGTVWAYWAICPVTGDPILARELPKPEEMS